MACHQSRLGLPHRLRLCARLRKRVPNADEGHGENAPLHTLFRARIPVGTWPCPGAPQDAILARILCLDGLDAANANTRARYIYIHGTSDTARLGTPASHGCIRLSPQDIAELYPLVPLGTEVSIS